MIYPFIYAGGTRNSSRKRNMDLIKNIYRANIKHLKIYDKFDQMNKFCEMIIFLTVNIVTSHKYLYLITLQL